MSPDLHTLGVLDAHLFALEGREPGVVRTLRSGGRLFDIWERLWVVRSLVHTHGVAGERAVRGTGLGDEQRAGMIRLGPLLARRGHLGGARGGGAILRMSGWDVSLSSARRDLSAIRLGTRVAGGRSRRVRRTVSSSGTVTLVGRFMSAMLSTGFAPGTVTGPTPRLPRRFPTRHQSSQSGPIDHPRVVGTRGKFPTFPGRLPRPQEVTRRVRGAIPRARTASGTSLGPPGRVVADRAPWPRSSSSRRWVPDVL